MGKMPDQAQLDAMLNTLPMTDEWLDLCAEAYMSELIKWDTGVIPDSEKPFAVFRQGGNDGFDFTKSFLTERESHEAYEKLTHRAAALRFLFVYNELGIKKSG
jgi:hypothetical protein